MPFLFQLFVVFFLRKFPFTLKLLSKFIDRQGGKVKGRPAPGRSRFDIAPPGTSCLFTFTILSTLTWLKLTCALDRIRPAQSGKLINLTVTASQMP